MKKKRLLKKYKLFRRFNINVKTTTKKDKNENIIIKQKE